MKSFLFQFLAVLACGAFLGGTALAQTPKVDFPAASPGCTIKQRVGLTDITVEYSRPSKKGRTIFGDLVPYGQVWRTGANAATKITFSTPVKLNGHDISAGTYALFTIPGEDEWTIILSKKADQFGAFSYNTNDDLVRFTTRPVAIGSPIETFTIEFNHIRDDSALLDLVWDQTVVPIKINLDIVDKLSSEIEDAMATSDKKPAGFYFQAATFYYNHNIDLSKALAWVNTGLEGQPSIAFEMLHLKAQILAKQGDKAGAIAAAKESIALDLKAEGPNGSFARQDQELISSLQ